jgi:hypothetical protein
VAAPRQATREARAEAEAVDGDAARAARRAAAGGESLGDAHELDAESAILAGRADAVADDLDALGVRGGGAGQHELVG